MASDEEYSSDASVESEALLMKPQKREPFRFFDLPSELRIRIYEYALLVPRTVDLEPANYRNIAPRLAALLTCRRMYEEAYRIFYSGNTFRLFPIGGRFFNTKKPLLARLSAKYRNQITSLELRLGPGWSKPPKCWTLKPRPRANLGLKDCTNIRDLYLFVEVDPSHDIFKGFRVHDSFYTDFCGQLVGDLLQRVPSIRKVQFDAYPSVSKEAPLVRELLYRVKGADKLITWGATSWQKPSAPSAGGIVHEASIRVEDIEQITAW